VLLELVYLGLKVVDVVSVCECYSTFLQLLQLLLHSLDLQVLHDLELLKLTGLNLGVTPGFLDQNQMLIICMPRIKLSYIRSEYKHRILMSLLYRILLQKLITSPERTK
jgi:hypothetical protein